VIGSRFSRLLPLAACSAYGGFAKSYVIYHALKFGTGDLNPHWFAWPTLFQYLIFFLYGLFYCAGLILGRFRSASDLLYLYCKDPTWFFLIGRSASAILGTASILLVYRITKEAYPKAPSAALIGASLFTMMPMAVEYSHYAVVDMPLTFMILAALLFIVRISRNGRLGDYALGGLCIGLAIGTKYSGVFVLFPLIAAHLLAEDAGGSRPRLFSRSLAVSAICAAAGFVAACPFSVLDHRQFIVGLHEQYIGAKIGWFGWERTNSYLSHISQNMRSGIGTLPLILSCAGAGYAGLKRDRSDLVLLSFVIPYFLLIGWGRNPYARFMLPLVPSFAVFCGRLLSDAGDACRRIGAAGAVAFVALFACALAEPFRMSVEMDRSFTMPDTRTIAKEWIEENIVPGSRILMNGYGPPLKESPASIRRRAGIKSKTTPRFEYERMRGIFYQMREAVAAEGISYEIQEIAEPTGLLEGKPEYEAAMSNSTDAILNYRENYDYLVISDALLGKFYGYRDEAIPQRYRVFKTFYRSLEGLRPMKAFAAERHASKGPTIRIYRMEGAR